MSDTKLKVYPGEAVEVSWDRRLCIHIGECGRAGEGLFVSGREPWCEPDRVEVERAIDVVERCPTGALAYRRKDGGAEEHAPPVNTVTVANHGPLYLRGELAIEGAPADMPGVRFRASLCRCGQSKQKPFCDNTHEEAGFRDRGAVGQSGEGLTAEGGPLEVKCLKNGPVVLYGNFTIHAASGRPAWRGTRAALCRCGGSANKPFCDSAHKANGFTTE